MDAAEEDGSDGAAAAAPPSHSPASSPAGSPAATTPTPGGAAATASSGGGGVDLSYHYVQAIRKCSDGLEIDPLNVHGQHDKLLYRRGLALMGVGELEAALKDFSIPQDPACRAKAGEVKAALKKLRDKERRMWGAAFSKNSAEGGEGASPASTPVKGGAGGRAAATAAAASTNGSSSGESSPTRGTSSSSAAAFEPEGWTHPREGGAAAARVGGSGGVEAGRTPYARTRKIPAAVVVEESGEGAHEAGQHTATATMEKEETASMGEYLSDLLPYAAIGAVALLGVGVLVAWGKSRR